MAMFAKEATSHESTLIEEKLVFSWPLIDSLMAAGRSSCSVVFEVTFCFRFCLALMRDIVAVGSKARGFSSGSDSESASPDGDSLLLFLDPFSSTSTRLEEMLLVSLSSPLLESGLLLVCVAFPASFLIDMGMFYDCGTGVVGNRKKSIAFKPEFNNKLRLHVTCIPKEIFVQNLNVNTTML